MILIVDDDKAVRLSLGVLLKRSGHEVLAVDGPQQALDAVRGHDTEIRLVIMDMNYGRGTSGEDGLELLRKVKVFLPEIPVILITAWGSIPLAVEGMRLGAFDFITKPWDNRSMLQQVNTALALTKDKCDTDSNRGFDRSEIIGNNNALTELLNTAARVAPTDAPVLILGENGTGKELVAKAIHNNSPRRSCEMVMVNLGGISQSLFESEMFGHAKGAYTGAATDRKGRFELADKGTIFLDEIGDLDLSCQVKLLRVLQQHTFERLGESTPRSTDFRLISATNANLGEMVTAHTFREDLLYRINLITLRLPALRERRDDIPLLTRHFALNFARKSGFDVPEISADAMELLCKLPFPGNIRELKNLVERTILISQSPVLLSADMFSRCISDADMLSASQQPPLQASAASLNNIERESIEHSMRVHNGNISRVAAELGITRQTLYRKLEKYNIAR